MKWQILLIVSILAFLTIGADGCFITDIGEGPGTPEDQAQWRSPTNPKIALENLEWCYDNAEYYDKYEELIHDSFTFYFSEHDTNSGLPATYNRNEDLDATLSLFENDSIGAENIDLTLSIPDNYLQPEDDETTERMDHIGYDLWVTVTSQQKTYHAQHTASFELTRDDDADSDEARWWISKWWDEYTGG